MDTHLRQACLFQCAMEGPPQIAAFVWGSKVRTENQIISIPCWPLGQASLQLNHTLGGEQLLHLGRERDGSSPGFCFRRTCFQTCAGRGIVREVANPPDGLFDREAAAMNIAPPKTGEFCHTQASTKDKISTPVSLMCALMASSRVLISASSWSAMRRSSFRSRAMVLSSLVDMG